MNIFGAYEYQEKTSRETFSWILEKKFPYFLQLTWHHMVSDVGRDISTEFEVRLGNMYQKYICFDKNHADHLKVNFEKLKH